MSIPASTPLTITADNSGDMLALAAHTLGYTPRNSMMVIGFASTGHVGGHFRVDLIAALASPEEVAHRALPAFESGYDAIAVLFFRDGAPRPASRGKDTAESRTLAIVAEAFAAVEVPVISSFQYGAGYVRPLSTPGHDTAPFPGDLITMDTQAAYVLAPETEHTPADTVARYTTAQPDPHTAEEINQAGADCGDGLQALAQVATAEAPTDTLTSTELAGLLTLLTDDAPLFIANAATGFTDATEVLTTAETTGLPAVADSTGEAPDWAQIDRIADALAIAAGYATGTTAANLYAVMAWIEWAKGGGAAAALFIDEARHLEPDNIIADNLAQLSQWWESRWSQRAETAYRPTR